MTLSIAENVKVSFDYAKNILVGKWVDWLLLIVFTIIPVVNFIGIGRYLKIFRGEDPSMDDIGKCFMDGLFVFVIGFIYLIIPMIVAVIFAIIPIIGWIIDLVIMVAAAALLIPAIYNFANKGFGAAFAIKESIAEIKQMGVGAYLISIVVFMLLFLVIALLNIIPVIGTILGFVVMPFLLIMGFKYIANLLA